MDWVQFKDYLSEVTTLDEDALHIYAAVAIQFATALILRKSIAHPLPWLSLLAVLVVNEALDLVTPGRPVEEWQILAGSQDIWNTMALPTMLMLLARYAPALITGPGRAGTPANLQPPTNPTEKSEN